LAAAALLIIHKSHVFFRASSEADFSLKEDLISIDTTTPFDPSTKDSNHHVFSFITTSFDQMHQYSVIFIILSSGFWQYFVQGLMSQLALGPLSSSQYQINLFWIQQCHLTIGTIHPLPSHPFLHSTQVPFLAAASAMLAP
jgi:hypothetical protein